MMMEHWKHCKKESLSEHLIVVIIFGSLGITELFEKQILLEQGLRALSSARLVDAFFCFQKDCIIKN